MFFVFSEDASTLLLICSKFPSTFIARSIFYRPAFKNFRDYSVK